MPDNSLPPHINLQAAIKYNPHLWGADELRAIFVVRHTELQDIVDTIKQEDHKRVPQHLLICGYRGMGKSTLLQRIALEVVETPELHNQWVTLVFPEEQYTVRTLAEFWLNVLDAFADALEKAGAGVVEMQNIDAKIKELSTLPADQAEGAAIEFLGGWIAEHHRGLILLIDSTDRLFNDLSAGESRGGKGKGNASTLWRLRHVLSHQPGLLWIGASYQALESQHQYQDAFHDFFTLRELRPLSVAEMRCALLALARQFGVGRELKGESAEEEMARILDAKPERLQTLRLLSGGNPRTTVTLFELFAAGGEDDIFTDLKRLLDTMTPLYKARMESLSDQSQKIFAHLMEMWQPVGVRELAEISGIALTTLSGQLARLEIDGLVEKAKLSGKTKRSGYQAGERLFNIWYLMRYGTRRLRQRLTWAVEFMRLWFSREELAVMAHNRADCHARGELCSLENLEFSRAVAASLGENDRHSLALDWSVFGAAHRQGQRTRKAIHDLFRDVLFDLKGEDRDFKDADDYLNRFAALDAELLKCPHMISGDEDKWINSIKGSLSLSLELKEKVAWTMSQKTSSRFQYEELCKVFQEERETFEKMEKYSVEGVQVVVAATQQGRFFPDCPSSKLAYIQMEACFVEQPSAYLLGYSLVKPKRGGDIWVERILKQAIALHEANAFLWDELGDLLQDHLKRYDESEAAYRRAIELDEKFAYPWNGLGNLLQYHLKRYDESEAAYRRAIELDENIAYPWNGLGNLLQNHLKRYEESEAAYRRAIELDEKFAYPWNGLGNLLQDHLKRYDESEAAYRRAIELDEKYAYPWNGLGNLLQYHLKRYDESEAAYRRAIKLDEKIAYPWNGLGNLLQEHLKRYEESESAYRRATELDKKFASPWNGLGNLLQDHLKRYEESESAYRRAIELDANSSYPLANLARLCALCNKLQEATTHYREVLPKVEESELELCLQSHLWLGNRDLAVQALHRMAEQAAGGDRLWFYRLGEQCWECSAIGLGVKLAELMEQSDFADFLLPFSLALRSIAEQQEPIGAAPEILSLAKEVAEEIRHRLLG